MAAYLTSHAGSSKCSKQKRVARRDGGLGLAFARTPPLNSALELRSRRAPRTRALRARQPGHRAVLQPCVRVFCRQATACPEPPAGLRVFVLINNRDRKLLCFYAHCNACLYLQSVALVITVVVCRPRSVEHRLREVWSGSGIVFHEQLGGTALPFGQRRRRPCKE